MVVVDVSLNSNRTVVKHSALCIMDVFDVKSFIENQKYLLERDRFHVKSLKRSLNANRHNILTEVRTHLIDSEPEECQEENEISWNCSGNRLEETQSQLQLDLDCSESVKHGVPDSSKQTSHASATDANTSPREMEIINTLPDLAEPCNKSSSVTKTDGALSEQGDVDEDIDHIILPTEQLNLKSVEGLSPDESLNPNLEKSSITSVITPFIHKEKVNINQSVEPKQKESSPFRNREREVELLAEKLSSCSFWEKFGESATGKHWKPKSDESMVRVGEFSPANPHLQVPGQALLGLGEYEERRRQLLERKKQEYKDYLSQTRNLLHKTDHTLSSKNGSLSGMGIDMNAYSPSAHNINGLEQHVTVDAATQTDAWLMRTAALGNGLTSANDPGTNSVISGKLGTDVGLSQGVQTLLSTPDHIVHPLSPREKHNLELQHHLTPSFVTRAHISQTTEQLPDARIRHIQHQEELKQQILEKRRLEAERRERERLEEEALQRRVAEQQVRLQAEYEREEKARREREIQKQQQVEDFQRRQEELRIESEQLKLEERRRKQESAAVRQQQEQLQQQGITRIARNAHLVPHAEPTPISILKNASPPPRSPRPAVVPAPVEVVMLPQHLPDQLPQPQCESLKYPPSPRALIRVLEGPTISGRSNFEDSLPIPLMPSHESARRSPHQSPHHSPYLTPCQSPDRSPHRSPHRSPQRSPQRTIHHRHSPVVPAARRSRSKTATLRHPSEAMQNLEERWKVPAVQKNVCVREQADKQNNTRSVLTQLGAFRRQLQLEHMRMEEKIRETQRQQPQVYQQQHNHRSYPSSKQRHCSS